VNIFITHKSASIGYLVVKGFFRSPPETMSLVMAVAIYIEGYWASRANYKGWGIYLQIAALLGALGLTIESALYGRHVLAALSLALSGAGAWLTWRLVSAKPRNRRCG